MNLDELYRTSIRIGRDLDPRGAAALDAQLDTRRVEYDALPGWRKPFYDQERFTNPFGDVRIVNGDRSTEISTAMVGIDIGLADILLADRLRQQGTPIDAVVAHHTHGIGIAPAAPWDFMAVLIDVFVGQGVDRVAAERVITPSIETRISELEDFHRLGPDAAHTLGFPLIAIHTPADYYIGTAIAEQLAARQVETVEDILAVLVSFPEFASAARMGVLPSVPAGHEGKPAGRVLASLGGGYLMPPDSYALLGAAGVNTVAQIHCSPAHARAAELAGVTIVRLPHAAADNLGMNLLLDAVEREHGRLDLITTGGFERIRRAA